jgi:hypothetical protein
MSKTPTASKAATRTPTNENKQFPKKNELLKNTLNGGIQSRRKTMGNSTTRQEEMQEAWTLAPFR